jgi:hypothetical protein
MHRRLNGSFAYAQLLCELTIRLRRAFADQAGVEQVEQVSLAFPFIFSAQLLKHFF